MDSETPDLIPARVPGFPFVPVARYHKPSGWIIYLTQDTYIYRTDQITDRYKILWHPDKPEAIGVKILVGSPEDILQFLTRCKMDPNKPIPLHAIFTALQEEISLLRIHGRQAEQLLAKFYSIGEEVVGNATLAPERWQEAITEEAVSSES